MLSMFLVNSFIFFFFLAVFTFLFAHHLHDEAVNHSQGGDAALIPAHAAHLGSDC